ARSAPPASAAKPAAPSGPRKLAAIPPEALAGGPPPVTSKDLEQALRPPSAPADRAADASERDEDEERPSGGWRAGASEEAPARGRAKKRRTRSAPPRRQRDDSTGKESKGGILSRLLGLFRRGKGKADVPAAPLNREPFRSRVEGLLQRLQASQPA